MEGKLEQRKQLNIHVTLVSLPKGASSRRGAVLLKREVGGSGGGLGAGKSERTELIEPVQLEENKTRGVLYCMKGKYFLLQKSLIGVMNCLCFLFYTVL